MPDEPTPIVGQTMIGGLPVIGREPEHDPAGRDYDYFAYAPPERLTDLRKQIEEREKKLFELQLAEVALDGRPDDLGTISHGDFAKLMDAQQKKVEATGDPWVRTQVCPCNACELARVRSSIAGMLHGINKLKALYKTLGTK